MLTYENEIVVRRGETWTLDKFVQNRDGSPFIISDAFKNPYWLITVTSSQYGSKNRYLFNKWLDLKSHLRFCITKPLKLSDYGLTFSDNTFPFLNGDGTDFTGDETSGYASSAIFYEKDSEGVISYKYWEYYNNEKDDFTGKWVDYKCPIVTSFTNEITSEWIEGNYLYQILLVDGTDLREYLKEMASRNNIPTDDPNNVIYDNLKAINPELVEGVDLDKPILKIDYQLPILTSTKLTVQSNLWR